MAEETEKSEETDSEAPESKGPSTPTRVNPLSKPSDAAERPGFRSPANKGSKAVRRKKKRKK